MAPLTVAARLSARLTKEAFARVPLRKATMVETWVGRAQTGYQCTMQDVPTYQVVLQWPDVVTGHLIIKQYKEKKQVADGTVSGEAAPEAIVRHYGVFTICRRHASLQSRQQAKSIGELDQAKLRQRNDK